jgi:hypothetical protein
MTNKEKLHQILSSLWKNDNSIGKTYYNQALQDVQTAIDLQEDFVSKDLDMSRAEKFIEDCTRNCSNIVVYSGMSEGSELRYHEWLTPDQARSAVEIAREELFEKVCKFLDNDLCCYIKAQDFAIEHQRLENDLKQVIKDE